MKGVFLLTSMYTHVYMDTMASIAATIKRLRKRKGLTQAQLAKKAGLHRVGLGMIEVKMRTPTLETRKKLAKALGVDIMELLG